jgi:hypothetical protein
MGDDRMPWKCKSALRLAGALSFWSMAALAQSDDRFVNDVDAKQRAACTPDVQRLCNQFIPDVPAIVACLTRQQANLSAACADVFAIPEDCKGDIQLRCASASPPGLLGCLKQERASLSAACASAMAESEAPPPEKAKPAKKAAPKKTADKPAAAPGATR